MTGSVSLSALALAACGSVPTATTPTTSSTTQTFTSGTLAGMLLTLSDLPRGWKPARPATDPYAKSNASNSNLCPSVGNLSREPTRPPWRATRGRNQACRFFSCSVRSLPTFREAWRRSE